MSQLTKQSTYFYKKSGANEHIFLTSKHIEISKNKSLQVEAVHMGLASVVFTKSVFQSLFDRGLELYLLILPLLLIMFFL